MPDGRNVIETRQETEVLFALPPVPADTPPFLLAAGGSIVIPAQPSASRPLGKKVAGYAAVDFLAISDQGMSLVVEEANDPEGPYVVVATFASAVAGTLQAIRERVIPIGSFMRVTLSNTGGPEALLSFKGIGLPVT
jgi:hypothetical protein